MTVFKDTMKIGIDIRGTQLQHGGRGIGNYIYTLIQGLASEAPQNEYLLIGFPDRPVPAALQPLPRSCRVVPLPTPLRSQGVWYQRLRGGWRLSQSVRRTQYRRDLQALVRREGLDVLHLTHILEPLYDSEGTFGCRVVKTLYDLIPLMMRADFLDRWPASEQRLYERQMMSYREADAVIAISESARKDALQHLSLSPERISTVYCAVPEAFSVRPGLDEVNACLQKFGLDAPYFLFGTGGPNKNWERTLRAFARFVEPWGTPCQCVMIGAGDADEIMRVKSLAYDIGLNRRQFQCIGFTETTDMVCLYTGALALISASLYEGFGLPAAQAMRLGTPVIASDVSSLPEVVGDAGLLVDPCREEEIAGAMERLAADPDLRADLSRRGVERSRQFSIARQARQTLEVYGSAPARSEAVRED